MFIWAFLLDQNFKGKSLYSIVLLILLDLQGYDMWYLSFFCVFLFDFFMACFFLYSNRTSIIDFEYHSRNWIEVCDAKNFTN